MVHRKTANSVSRAAVVLSIAIALLNSTGCASSDSALAAGSAGVPTGCFQDVDCGPGLGCQDGVCIGPDTNAQQLMLIATPPSHSDEVAAHEPELLVIPGQPLAVTLPKTVKIAGHIGVSGNLLESASVPATVLAVAKQQLVPGAHRVASAVADASGFELKLEAGVEYTISVRADDRTRPIYQTTAQFEADGVLKLTLPDLESLPHLSGRILQAEESMNRPLEGVTVTAIETTTDARCTSTTTDLLGAYEIACPSNGTYVLRVSSDSEGPAIPQFDAVFDGKTDLIVMNDLEIDPLVLPLQARTTIVSVEVNGEVSGNIAGLEGIDVSLSATLDDNDVWTNAVFTATGTTDVGGDVNLSVVPGTYTLEVLPSTVGTHGAIQTSLTVGDGPESKSINLANKPTLRGTIRAADGAPVARAQVEALMKITDPTTGTVGERQYSVRADDDGVYELPVDGGAVTLNVVPTDESGLPRWTAEQVDIAGDTIRDVTLAAGQVLTGQVVGSVSTQVEGVAVEFYRQTTGTPRLIGRGYSAADGTFQVVLPAE